MMSLLRPLLATCLCLLLPVRHCNTLAFSGFHYQDLSKGITARAVAFHGVKLRVESLQPVVSAVSGSNITLPCHFSYEPEPTTLRTTRVKWYWLPSSSDSTGAFSLASSRETEVIVAMGDRQRSYGSFEGRVSLSRSMPGDASLIINELSANDTGRYRCEVIDRLEDESVTVELELRGVVFPYYSKKGRYLLNFFRAKRACKAQGATLATFDQLFTAWKEGLEWCNAGWLADGTVQYPIRKPREKCGGEDIAPGVRSYGQRHLSSYQYDAFCFSASIPGSVYLLQRTRKLNFAEAVRACAQDGSKIAKVSQLYVAWKFKGLDNCNAGWLADGSVRYPITRPRHNCGSSQPGVRNFGFPPLDETFDVYCFR